MISVPRFGQSAGETRPPQAGRLVHALALAAIVALVMGASLSGLFLPLDNVLTDRRFALSNRPPTGSIVFVEIDPASLRHVGVRPWPRHVYAELLDRLMAMGARQTVFNINFGSASSEAEDTAFEEALRRAGGYALLAAFRQFSPVSGHIEVTLPLHRFRAVADPVILNVAPAPAGVVRRYPAGLTVAGRYYPSLAGALSGAPLLPGDQVFLDYGIDAAAIERISAADVLEGKVDPARLAGKQVVIGASAQEMRDLVAVPRFGTLPGSLLQIEAAETLKQHRALRSSGHGLPLGLVAGFGLVFLLLRGRVSLWLEAGAALVLLLVVEGLALGLQAFANLLLSSAAIEVALFGFLAAAVLQELATKRQLHAEAARQRDATRRILDQVVADNFDGIIVMDDAGFIVAASRMAERLLDNGNPLVGRHGAALLPDGVDAAVDHVMSGEAPAAGLPAMPSEATVDLAGARRTLEYVATGSEIATGEGTVMRVVCLSFRDITERRANAERLAFLASHDPLTGTLSRPAFVAAVEAALSGDTGRDEGLTVAVIDLGRLQIVNDMFGHPAGDQVMREVAARLEMLGLLAVGRVHGNRFAVARRGHLGPAEARQFGEFLVDAVAGTYALGQSRAVLTAHAGVTTSAVSGFDGDALLSHADMAASTVKPLPGNLAGIFSTSMTQQLAEKQELEVALRQAIAEGQLRVHYQPQLALGTGELVAVEALLRWHHPRLGDVPPSHFIPVAEETGLVTDLGRFVLRTACREVAGWPGALRVAVNISPVQFELGDMLAEVSAALALANLVPERLEIEITEGLFVDHGHPANRALERLRLGGVSIALDDFGTGYSSLSYLARLPVDKLKIDRSFVHDLPHDPDAKAVARAILTLARTLGKASVAEGVETEAQAISLRELGCDLGQGHLYGRPMPADDIRAIYLAGGVHPVALAG